MTRIRVDLNEEELAFVDGRIRDGWAVSRQEVFRQAILALYLRRQWLGEKKFRAEMTKAGKKPKKAKSNKI